MHTHTNVHRLIKYTVVAFGRVLQYNKLTKDFEVENTPDYYVHDDISLRCLSKYAESRWLQLKLQAIKFL